MNEVPAPEAARQNLIESLENAGRRSCDPDEIDSFLPFLRRYYDSTPFDEVQGRDPEELCMIALQHMRFARQRRKREALVRVYTPSQQEHGWTAPFSVVETVVPDGPFLVDSLTMAVREVGGAIENFNHPVIDVERDADGTLLGVSSPDTPSKPESFIHIEFEAMGTDAAHEQLEARVREILRQQSVVVNDWMDMRRCLQAVVHEVNATLYEGGREMEEIRDFLHWLDDDHFTFLGYRAHRLLEDSDGMRLTPMPETGLGLLSASQPEADMDAFMAPAGIAESGVSLREPLIITKANDRSPIHHPEYMDAVLVKRFDREGNPSGVHLFMGLFSAEAYTDSPRMTPVLRQKVARVLRRSRLRPNSHAAKSLQEIMETLPRDQLFQATEQELFDAAMGLLDLRERERIRLFLRRDRYRRYYYCMVYVPRDQYGHDLRDRIGQVLFEGLQGNEIETEEQFLLRGMARILFTVHTDTGEDQPISTEALEARIIAAARGWKDDVREALIRRVGDETAAQVLGLFRDGIPASYMETTEPDEAAADLRLLARVQSGDDFVLRVVPAADEDDSQTDFRLKIFVGADGLSLSDVLPSLENFGVRVLGQRPHELQTSDGRTVWIQEFDMHHPDTVVSNDTGLRNRFEMAFTRTWRGQVENDGFNRLVLGAGLHWRQVTLVRALCKYLLQTPLPISQHYMHRLLAGHAEIIAGIVTLFENRFDPRIEPEARAKREQALVETLESQLDEVTSLDADRPLRALISVVRACVRTNFYQRGEKARRKHYISFKLLAAQVPELPQPRPLYETFVYSPQMEGIHLRGGRVARGGIRWSDRREDFRTEILGLMKAQMVKNAVIVPVGAKGGFVVKGMPADADRDTQMRIGIECYTTLIRGLLDVTDNLEEGQPVPPPGVVRHDEDDPYLVVAADKGTATFSDIANGIAADYRFWLGDAFASGGSHGYDHKKIGITARGAWESVKRHFLEMGHDIDREPFTVAGIGDMGGDVFGNGMLLSRQIKLVAAFNHQHIFIDPDPDPETSFAERERLFALPRSSWTDYDSDSISEGGGIYSRSAKRIRLSPQAQQALGIEGRERFTPNELIHEILKAPVDLLWNGGIGTYVKATAESHAEVGDRANEALRVNGRELRCKVVGEGGNLGLTQRGRIEYALRGGRMNTDFIDNSGGVDCSDREVNIKIPLNELLLRGEIEQDARDSLLESMTNEVADLVLRDNFLQSQAISLLEQTAPQRLDEHAYLMRLLESDGILDRSLENLPDEERLNERRAHSQGLTRPEIATLLAFAKIDLYGRVVASDLCDDPFLERMLLETFPPALCDAYGDALRNHRLRREIIATALTNNLINRVGIAYARRLADEQGLGVDRTAHAYLTAREVLDVEALWSQIDALESQLPAATVYGLFEAVAPLLKHAMTWLVSHRITELPLTDAVARYRDGLQAFARTLPESLHGSYLETFESRFETLTADGVPESLATQLAGLPALATGLDVVDLSQASGMSLETVAQAHFQVGEHLNIPWLFESIGALDVTGRWQALARATLREDVFRLHHNITARVLQHPGDDPQARIAAWEAANSDATAFGLRRLRDLKRGNANDFMGLAVGVRDLRNLSHLA